MASRPSSATRSIHVAAAAAALEVVDGGLLGDVDVSDPEAMADAAGLRYVDDRAPGIHRVRRGKGIRYVSATGATITNERTLARIASLAVPPAWRDVWICTRADGHLQATGFDQRGRKQYRYHPRWRAVRDAAKFEHMLDFGAALPAVRARVASDLSGRSLSRDRVAATVVSLLDRTRVRVGNERYVEANGSFGLTTLRNRHVRIEGSSLHLRFRGKGGLVHEHIVTDRRLARIVRSLQDLPGQELFQYVDREGHRQSLDSRDVNEYLHEVAGHEVTAKDFRTWGATVSVTAALRDCGPCTTAREHRRHIADAVAAAAGILGNTPTVCRTSYVHPAVLDAYVDGTICAQDEALRRSPVQVDGLDEAETLTLAVLRTRQSHALERAIA